MSSEWNSVNGTGNQKDRKGNSYAPKEDERSLGSKFSLSTQGQTYAEVLDEPKPDDLSTEH